MEPAEAAEFSLQQIIDQGLVETHFQPIVSPREISVAALEALSRGRHHQDGSIIPPHTLFTTARAEDRLIPLDRLCRQKAIQAYAALECADPKPLLSLNFETALVDTEVMGSGHLLNSVEAAGLSPGQIILEIVESGVRDTKALSAFIDRCREQGFLLALDDVGAGHSNLERIPLIKPDFIKIDRFLISGLEREFFKQEVVRSLNNLGHSIGALVVAEGAENEAEASTALELGVDLVQGYYFARPSPNCHQAMVESRIRLEQLAANLKRRLLGRLRGRHAQVLDCRRLGSRLVAHLSRLDQREFDQHLGQAVDQHPELECLYVLDEVGIQVSSTVLGPRARTGRGSGIFRPAPRGADQSLKDYFLRVTAQGDAYVSDSYISWATGHRCITVSLPFRDGKGQPYILCADFWVDREG
jgi:EAL domain-containing protein (putative c-di-GMP-specific phosphodiesterase class I)